MSVNVRWLSTGLIILAASLALLISPLLAAGKLDVVTKFQQPNLELDVATYTEPENKPSKIGLLGLAAGTVRNSFAFNAQEWPNLIAAVAKAVKAQSMGNNWTVVAELTEVGTTDVSHLVISAGPGIRFALILKMAQVSLMSLPRAISRACSRGSSAYASILRRPEAVALLLSRGGGSKKPYRSRR